LKFVRLSLSWNNIIGSNREPIDQSPKVDAHGRFSRASKKESRWNPARQDFPKVSLVGPWPVSAAAISVERRRDMETRFSIREKSPLAPFAFARVRAGAVYVARESQL